MPGSDPAVLFPLGTDIVTYAHPGWINESSSFPGGDPGLDGAEAVASPSGPQGLALQLPGSSVVVWPMMNERRVGSLAETLPGGKFIALPK
jgi:hypothetical protein